MPSMEPPLANFFMAVLPRSAMPSMEPPLANFFMALSCFSCFSCLWTMALLMALSCFSCLWTMALLMAVLPPLANFFILPPFFMPGGGPPSPGGGPPSPGGGLPAPIEAPIEGRGGGTEPAPRRAAIERAARAIAFLAAKPPPLAILVIFPLGLILPPFLNIFPPGTGGGG